MIFTFLTPVLAFVVSWLLLALLRSLCCQQDLADAARASKEVFNIRARAGEVSAETRAEVRANAFFPVHEDHRALLRLEHDE